MKNLTFKIRPFIAAIGAVSFLAGTAAMADSYSDLSRQSYERQEAIAAQRAQAEEKAKTDQNNSLYLKKVKWLGAHLHQSISSLVCYDNMFAHGDGDNSPWCNARGVCVSVLSEGAYNPYPLSPLSWPGMFERATAPRRAKEIRVCHFELSSGIACSYERNYNDDGNQVGSYNCLNRAGKVVVDQTVSDDNSGAVEPVKPRNEETSTPPEAE